MAINTRDFHEGANNRTPSEESERVSSRRWGLRAAGALLLVAGWAVVSFVGGPLVSGAVFVALGAYAYIAAATSRRMSVDEEKRLRMELLVHNMELEKLTSKDDLTQLYNRRYFVERLEREMKTAHGFSRPVAVLLIDIDGMGNINSKHGQRVGDEVLAGFGKFLLSQTRASDLPARVDGDLFAVILPDTAQDGADIMIDRLTTALKSKPVYDDGHTTIDVSVSLGLAGYPWSGETPDAVIKEAELAASVNRRSKDVAIVVDADESEQPVPAIFRRAAEGEETPDAER